MITVEMVRDKGFEFVAQDVINVSYPENEPDYQVIENRYLVDVNEKNPPWHDCDVKEFAWRDNKGEMPCDGELWVEIYDSLIRQAQTYKACNIHWGEDLKVKWRPSFKNWESEKIESGESKVEHLNLVVKLENQQQVDVVNKIWRDSNIELERARSERAFISSFESFPLIAYLDCDWLDNGRLCGWEHERYSDNQSLAIEFYEFLEKVKHLANQVETPEEKEAFEDMANSSEVPNSSEWKSGDECIYMNHKVVHQFVGPCPKRDGYGYIQAPGFEINFVELSKLSKPETPEQKAERERLEAAYDLYLTITSASPIDYDVRGFDDFKSESSLLTEWLSIVDKTGYRKQNG